MMTELESQLQSAEARCKVLEKQLDYMRKMVENAKKEKNNLMVNQVGGTICFSCHSLLISLTVTPSVLCSQQGSSSEPADVQLQQPNSAGEVGET